MDDSDKWKKRFERERAARREAEHLLEHKSLELYEANRRLADEVVQKGSELEEQEQLFGAIFHASMDGIVLLDGRGRMMEANDAVLRMLGFARSQLQGKGVTRLFAEKDRLLARNSFREVVKTGYCRYEAGLVRSDGSLFPAEIVGSRVWVGKKMIINGVVRDISQRRRNISALRVARDEATRANQAKSLFLASMSHEIRTPLNGVLGFTEVVLGSDLSEEQRRHLELVKSSGEILIHIINDLLDFSKIESGQMVIENKNFDLEAMMKEVIEITSQAAIEKELEVTLEIDAKLPKVIKGDLFRVRQVVLNLVSNAVKFTKEGFVRIKARAQGEQLEISVVDSGIGFEEANSYLLFEAFSQADAATTRKFGGTGLGLAICRNLAQAMDGNIEAHGELNKGATFLFSLPLVRGDHAGGEGETEKVVADQGEMKTGKFILIAEDNSINSRLLTIMLKKLGHASQVATTGTEVLALLRGDVKFDAVLMDRHMPEMDGVAAAELIRAGEAGEHVALIPIVAVTASALEEDRELCLASGMNDFLAKPLRPSALEEVLRKLFL